MSKLLELLDVIRTDPDVINATLVIWSIVLGIIIALFVSFYNRRIIGSFFRALVKAEATDEETAKTLSEISQTENDAVIKKLRRSQYKDIVTIVNSDAEQSPVGDGITVDKNTKFYIKEDKITRVRDQWGETNESVWVLIGGVIGIIILGVLVTIIIAKSIVS